MPVRIPVVAMVLVLGLTCGLVGLATLSARPAEPSVPGRPGPHPEPVAARFAVDVLHDWDARRAAAWARGDASSLQQLYTPGSSAGAADVALLRRYASRGLVVHDLRMQVLEARVLVMRAARIELEVTDRLAGGIVVHAGETAAGRRLPADLPTTRRLALRRDHGQWLMARVASGAGSGGR